MGWRRWDTKELCQCYLLYQGSLVETPDAPNHLSVPQPSSVSPGKFFKVIVHTHLRDWFFKCSTSHCDIKGPVFSNVPLFCHWLLSKLVKVKSELPVLQTEMLPLTVIGFESIPELCAALPLLQSSGDSIPCLFSYSSVWTAGPQGQRAHIHTVPCTGDCRLLRAPCRPADNSSDKRSWNVQLRVIAAAYNLPFYVLLQYLL